MIFYFEKKGFINLKESNQDKRSRIILPTEKGREFQNQVIPTINQAEFAAFAALPADEQEMLTGLWEKYTDVCVAENGEKKGRN